MSANDYHASAVRLSQDLAHTNSLPGVRDVLRTILANHCGTVLDESDLEYVVDALADPVAFAMTERYERGIKYGSLSTRQNVAARLGLGRLPE